MSIYFPFENISSNLNFLQDPLPFASGSGDGGKECTALFISDFCIRAANHLPPSLFLLLPMLKVPQIFISWNSNQ